MFHSIQDIATAITHCDQRILDPYTEVICQAAKPSIWFTIGAPVTKETPIGISRIGGAPDVSHDFVWPTHNNQPLTFLYQLAIDDHLIAVFIGAHGSGADVPHHVEFFPKNTPLAPATVPTNRQLPRFYDDTNPRSIFTTPHTLTAHEGLDLPRWVSTAYEKLLDIVPDDEDIIEGFAETYEQFILMAEPDHGNVIVRFGGYHRGIGYDPAEFITDGSNVADWSLLTCLESVEPSNQLELDKLCIWDAGYFQILQRTDTNGNRHTYGSLET